MPLPDEHGQRLAAYEHEEAAEKGGSLLDVLLQLTRPAWEARAHVNGAVAGVDRWRLVRAMLLRPIWLRGVRRALLAALARRTRRRWRCRGITRHVLCRHA